MLNNRSVRCVLEQCSEGYVGSWKIMWQALFRGRDDDIEPDEDTREDYEQCINGSGSDFDEIRDIIKTLLDRGHIAMFSCLEPSGPLTPVESAEEIARLLREDSTWKKEPEDGVLSYYFGSTPEGDEVIDQEMG